MNRDQIRSDARLAGQVVRYHTWPMLRRDTIAEHTWNVLRIYLKIFGHPSGRVFEYIMWHDAPELMTGDIPFGVKSANPSLRVIIDEMELDALKEIGGTRPELLYWEKWQVKVCDLLEMMEAGVQEALMGNRYGYPIITGCKKELEIICSGPGLQVDQVEKVKDAIEQLRKKVRDG